MNCEFQASNQLSWLQFRQVNRQQLESIKQIKGKLTPDIDLTTQSITNLKSIKINHSIIQKNSFLWNISQEIPYGAQVKFIGAHLNTNSTIILYYKNLAVYYSTETD